MAVTVQVNSSEWRLIAAHSTAQGCCSVPTAVTLGKTCDETSRQYVPDLIKGDYVSRPLPHHFSVHREANMSTAELERVLRHDLVYLGGGDLAYEMVDHFIQGSGQPIEHRNRSRLSNLASASPNFRRFANGTLRLIWQGLQRGGLAADRMQYTFYWRSQEFGWCEFSDDLRSAFQGYIVSLLWTPEPSQELRVVIGGTSGFKIFMRRLRTFTNGREIGAKCDLRFEICDHFGADERDHYVASLRALWLLQHARQGPHKPFCNLIIIERQAELLPGSLRLV